MTPAAHEEQFKKLAQKNGMPVNQVKAVILPDNGECFVLNGFLYKVCALNTGKMRFSASFIGAYKPEGRVTKCLNAIQKKMGTLKKK